ncbi:MAG: 23S rRNA pseudouridine(955/2504/2580) synthase RluC [Thiohalophilus sp.]|uniref:23S rRNA pseudouridine(955/2504/2580) synthase RluC n=1 Tax=Thiohalophilus sp. TaxID=3028392 RepID=UPI00286FE4F8|nr:23S rRNA pseudouridine(955/2504/2580) synthase RluC [Thiohalophilus sp.]MDR9435525.1 23S rRNA pseudouridine(955/2504/2580) synthase RluC [Thiohalophilus sp.]
MATKSSNPASTGVKMVTIGPEQAGQRIDNFLLTRLKGAPRSLIYRILRKGEVRVNKGRIQAPYRLKEGDQVRIPPVRLGDRAVTTPAERVLRQVEASILFEDKRIVILNKPSGLAVHGGSGISYGVIEALRALRPDAPFLELVHRLDRDTSGCLIIAKKRSALRTLHELLRENRIDKHYLALVKGEWHGGPARIEAPLKKNVLSSGERIVRVDPEGKAAISLFRPLAVNPTASLLDIKLETGRTHQIRVHATHEGHPIAGDDKYGDENFNKQLRNLGLKRLFLHARRLVFAFDDDGPHIDVTAPLEASLHDVLTELKLEFHE